MKNKIKILKFRRRREGRTDYLKRMALLKSELPRLVVRKSLKNVQVQLTEYAPEGDKVLVTCNSRELSKYGWKYSCSNIPASYLTGLLCAKKAKLDKEIVFDSGLVNLTKGNSSYAALKGAIDGGLKVRHSAENLPSDERISGKHIMSYEKDAKGNQFSALKKKGAQISNLEKNFEEVKNKIMSL